MLRGYNVWHTKPVRKWRGLAVHLMHEFDRHDYITHAAALAFFFMLALVPLVMLLASALAHLSAPHVVDELMAVLALIAPADAMQLLRSVVHEALQISPGLLSFGIFGTLFAASGGFSATISALNIAYDVPCCRPYWRRRLVAVLLTALVGLLILSGLAAIVVGPQFGTWLSAYFGVDPVFAALWPYLRWIAIFVFATLSVGLLYFVGPNLSHRLRAQVPGAVLAVTIWIIASYGLGWYLRNVVHTNHTYGTLGAVIALMLWLFITALAILVGGELNGELRQANSASSEIGADSRTAAA